MLAGGVGAADGGSTSMGDGEEESVKIKSEEVGGGAEGSVEKEGGAGVMGLRRNLGRMRMGVEVEVGKERARR